MYILCYVFVSCVSCESYSVCVDVTDPRDDVCGCGVFGLCVNDVCVCKDGFAVDMFRSVDKCQGEKLNKYLKNP